MTNKTNNKKKNKDDDLLLNQLKILQADFDNFKKRVEKERNQWENKGKADLIKTILPVLDDLKKAVKSSGDKGIELIYNNFLSLLKKQGIEIIDAKDKVFDIRLHEAVMIVESKDKDNIIVDVVEDGYTFNGEVIRPAKVVVSKKK